MSQIPAVNRAVLYVSHGTPPREDGTQAFPSVDRAATITEVGEDGVVGLAVLNPTGLFFHPLSSGGVPHDQVDRLPGTWHWPDLTGPKLASSGCCKDGEGAEA